MKTKFNPRRPYLDDGPAGYLESDRDFIANNHDLVLEFLESQAEAMVGYVICIAARPSHACELRLNAYLISPTGAQTNLYGHNNIFSANKTMLKRALKLNWPGIPITRDDNLYVVGVDAVPETHAERNNR